MQHKVPIFGGIGISIAITVGIMLVADHIMKLKYNNWGRGVYTQLQEITKTSYNDSYESNCVPKTGTTNLDLKKYLSCMLNNQYDLKNMWDDDYFKTTYNEKIKEGSADSNLKEVLKKLGTWEKLREVCTLEMESLITDTNLREFQFSLEAFGNKFFRTIDQKYLGYDNCVRKKQTTNKK